MTTLILEHDAALRAILGFLCRQVGAPVRNTPASAADSASWQEAAPDLILIGQQEPSVDAWAVCQQIRAASTTPIIFLSPSALVADAERARALGADVVLSLPFVAQELTSCVATLLQPEAPKRCQCTAVGSPSACMSEGQWHENKPENHRDYAA